MIGLVHTAGDIQGRHSPPSKAGRLAEDIAVRFLRRHGCTVVERNYRARSSEGDIDVVACQGAALVFVKVKTCTTDEYRAPDCAAGSAQRPALERAAGEYVRHSGLPRINMRFDQVSVVMSNPLRVDWQRDVIRPGPGLPPVRSGQAEERTLPGRAFGEKAAKMSLVSATVGAMVDVIGSILLMTPLVLLAMIRFHLHPGPASAIAAALCRYPMLFVRLALAGGVCCAAGGYVAAWIDQRHEILSGLLSSYLAVGVAAYSIASGKPGRLLPAALLLLATAPAGGWLGGWFRRAQRRSCMQPRSRRRR